MIIRSADTSGVAMNCYRRFRSFLPTGLLKAVFPIDQSKKVHGLVEFEAK